MLRFAEPQLEEHKVECFCISKKCLAHPWKAAFGDFTQKVDLRL